MHENNDRNTFIEEGYKGLCIDHIAGDTVAVRMEKDHRSWKRSYQVRGQNSQEKKESR